MCGWAEELEEDPKEYMDMKVRERLIGEEIIHRGLENDGVTSSWLDTDEKWKKTVSIFQANENKASSFPEQCEEEGPVTFEARPNPELIIKSVLEHFSYLKFGNSFRGIDNYNFTSPQPWSSLCPICDGKHGNYGLHGSWYRKNGNQFPYDPELPKFYSQDKLEYCLTCNTSSNKLKFAIVA
ncbi:hypothetical protein C1646_738549 [Rhizophagus diaphanus]|nr:hypothetical protein C1646_738549 [Rhizophagus diaphanus] [Rhizophagus sp. MUCL 43196]